LSLVRGHPVSLFFQKIEQEGSVLLAVLKGGAAEQEVIYILEEFTRGEMEGEEVPSQSLAKEVGTVPEPLRQNCPGQLLGSMRIWISPCEGKEVLGLWWTGIVKKASFRSRTVKWVVVLGIRDRRV
jgi:hypothetical protein